MVYVVEKTLEGEVTRWWNASPFMSTLSQSASTLILGRNPDKCSILLTDLNISRCHASLKFYLPYHCSLTDLNTPNGTLCDGETVRHSKMIDLRNPPLLRFANSPHLYTIQFERPGDPDKFQAFNSIPSSQHLRPNALVPNATENLSQVRSTAGSDALKFEKSELEGKKTVEAPENLAAEAAQPPITASEPSISYSVPLTGASDNLQKRDKKRLKFQSKWDEKPVSNLSEIEHTSSQVNSTLFTTALTGEQIAERLRMDAMERAKHLNEESLRNIKEKRKLLWGKKDPGIADKDIPEAQGNKAVHPDDVNYILSESSDPNQYYDSFESNSNKKSKFLKLMGFKRGIEEPVDSQSKVALTPSATKEVKASSDAGRDQQLEQQFYQGLRRLDGRKTGLGL